VPSRCLARRVKPWALCETGAERLDVYNTYRWPLIGERSSPADRLAGGLHDAMGSPSSPSSTALPRLAPRPSADRWGMSAWLIFVDGTRPIKDMALRAPAAVRQRMSPSRVKIRNQRRVAVRYAVDVAT
jgi:hypothetical protein